MHEQPHVPNERPRGQGPRAAPRLVIAIEPMFTAGGSDQYRTDRDGWTLRTADGTGPPMSSTRIAVTEEVRSC